MNCTKIGIMPELTLRDVKYHMNRFVDGTDGLVSAHNINFLKTVSLHVNHSSGASLERKIKRFWKTEETIA